MLKTIMKLKILKYGKTFTSDKNYDAFIRWWYYCNNSEKNVINNGILTNWLPPPQKRSIEK